MGDEPAGASWTAGNANDDAASTRGWLVGHFIDSSQGVRATEDVEVKWAKHHAGDKRSQWTTNERRTTLVILVSGEFRVNFTGGSAVLATPGDYVMWGPGVDHSWEALVESVVMTCRWPSAPRHSGTKPSPDDSRGST